MPQDKPKIALNLDTLERESVPEPFWITLGGKPYRLIDQQEIPWETLISLTANQAALLNAAVGADKRAEFVADANKLPAWKMNQLANAYREHYGLPAFPEAAASPTS